MSDLSPDRREARRQFEAEVVPAELAYVADRRRALDGDAATPVDTGALGTGNRLVGLAISGGGIRSAAFALGFVQSFGRRLFRRIDYLSTVSGGGFVGGAITALMATAFYRGAGRGERGPSEFPFPQARQEEEPEALSHLRNNSSYMTPAGLGDIFRVVAVLLRGILLNALSLLPFLLLVCLAVLLIYGQQLSDRSRFDNQVGKVDDLLARFYGDRLSTGDDAAREIDPLLEVLEGEALLRVAEGKDRDDVVHQLRPALSFTEGTERDLIVGNGTEDSPYRLTSEAGRLDLAGALVASDVLYRFETIEEVDLVVRALEGANYDHRRTLAGGGTAHLLDSLERVELIREGTRHEVLAQRVAELLAASPERRLKPVIQGLYNGEYLDEVRLAQLLRDALRRRSLERGDRRKGQPAEPPRHAYYAYGWYEARVGEPSAESWYARHPSPEERVASEIGQLLPDFHLSCAYEATGELVEECLRPGTTADDVRRLLEFEQVLAAGEPFAALGQPSRMERALRVLYYAEYLNETRIRELLRGPPGASGAPAAASIPGPAAPDPVAPGPDAYRLAERLIADGYRRCPLPEVPECCAVGGKTPEPKCRDRLPGAREELLSRLTLAERTVPEDLVDALFLSGDLPTVDAWPPLAAPPEGELARALAILEPYLDRRWIDRQVAVYAYGWHRRLMGRTHPANWCSSAVVARPGEGGCPAAGDESWAALARALRNSSRWDPGRLSLPLTWIAIQVGLGWIFLFPPLLLVVRAIYRRHQRSVANRDNPLAALLTSDRSLDWRNLYERTFGTLLAVVLGVALIELLPYAVHHFHYAKLRGESSRTLVVGALSLLVTALGGPAMALLKRFGRTVALVVLSVSGPLLVLTLFVAAMERAVYTPPAEIDQLLRLASGGLSNLSWGLFPDELTLWFVEGGRRLLDWRAAALLFAVVSVFSIGLALLIDINATSLHGLYRDRIAKAFMIGIDTEGSIEPEEDLPLHQICPAGSGAPYHLINVALNLQGSGDRSLRGRNSAPFFLSRDYAGGLRTGFCRTRNLGEVAPHAHLAGAVAVSAAAVSPNMGRYGSGPIAVLMSLLNTRLALWLPHPAAVRAWFGDRGDREGGESTAAVGRLRNVWRRFRLRAPATLLLSELSGTVHDRGPVVNLSDGGHIENTGALELLRRRCREIVLVDGEADPEMSFGGFAQLQRIARIDLGIEIEIDLAPLRRNEEGLSRTRVARGVLRYPPRSAEGSGTALAEETGRLLYVKLAVTGDEGQVVAEYRARHHDFPHQSTGDQAFDEAQFEAYRELGQLAGDEALAGVPDRSWTGAGEQEAPSDAPSAQPREGKTG